MGPSCEDPHKDTPECEKSTGIGLAALFGGGFVLSLALLRLVGLVRAIKERRAARVREAEIAQGTPMTTIPTIRTTRSADVTPVTPAAAVVPGRVRSRDANDDTGAVKERNGRGKLRRNCTS